ncbi:MAG: hypothetical protein Q8R31_01910, partial [Candidatus Omnitrophota bacterium]|nr:hypothetical protein [Candidatus Omnitrophota bacterium]
MKRKFFANVFLLAYFLFFQSNFIYALDSNKDSNEKYLKQADSYYGQQKWENAIWYYRKYLKKLQKDSSVYNETLYKLADIYYKKLQKYYYALKIYEELSGKIAEKDQIIKDRIKSLSLKSKDNFLNYSIEHDLNLLNGKGLFVEADKIFPERF